MKILNIKRTYRGKRTPKLLFYREIITPPLWGPGGGVYLSLVKYFNPFSVGGVRGLLLEYYHPQCRRRGHLLEYYCLQCRGGVLWVSYQDIIAPV